MLSNFDFVQITILAVAGTLLVVIAGWLVLTSSPVRRLFKFLQERMQQAQAAEKKERGLIVDVVLAAGFSATVFVLAFWFRELLNAGVIPIYVALIALFVVAASVLTFSIVANLPPRSQEEEGREPKKLSPLVTVILGIVAVTFILAPQAGPIFDFTRSLLEYLNLLKPSATGPAAMNHLTGDVNDVIQIALAALSTGTVVVTGAGVVAQRLESLVEDRNFLSWQRNAARRLRHSAELALDGTFISRYPTELRIDYQSLPRPFPLQTDKERRARIKLIIREGDTSRSGEPFDERRIRHLLESARVDLTNSLFFVCVEHRKQESEVLCYGTGRELLAISRLASVADEKLSAVGSELTDGFYQALNEGNADLVRKTVEDIRREFIGRQPEETILLSTKTHRASDELIRVLGTMAGANLDHILLVSHQPPFERGILGAAEIASYIRKGDATTPSGTMPLEDEDHP